MEKDRVKINHLSIRKFRSIKELCLDFNDLTILIGPNNAGKSNIMLALSTFFASSIRGLTETDFYQKNGKDPIEIEVKFDDLSDEEKITFRSHLVGDTLTVKKTISINEEGTLTSKLHGLHLTPLDSLLNVDSFEANKSELTRKIRSGSMPRYFLTERETLTKKSFQNALDRYIEENRETLEFGEPEWSEGFLGWKNVAQGKLTEVVFVPAIKEATDETKSSGAYMGKIVERLLSNLSSNENYKKAMLAYEQTKKGFTGGDESETRFREMQELEDKIGKTISELIPGVRAKLGVNFPNFVDVVSRSLNLTLDDGIETDVEFKGHGLQRSVIFALLRLYGEILAEAPQSGSHTANSLIIAIEEPELYLHPHHQRRFYDVLKQISEINQVVFCTHSSYFVDLTRYEGIRLISKESVDSGTTLRKSGVNLFKKMDSKTMFRAISTFDPGKSELFFAQKVILVEGASEKVAIGQITAKKGVNLDSLGISVVECEGKPGIPLFMEILNAFNIPYVVFHDTDLKEGITDDNRKLEQGRNKSILDLSGEHPVITFEPDLDHEIGIRIGNQKPFAVFKELSGKDLDKIPSELVEKIMKEITVR